MHQLKQKYSLAQLEAGAIRYINMPAKLMKIKQTGGVIIERKCEVKGCEGIACYGFDVDYRRTLKEHANQPEGQKHKANALLGRWYCKEHKHLGENGFV